MAQTRVSLRRICNLTEQSLNHSGKPLLPRWRPRCPSTSSVLLSHHAKPYSKGSASDGNGPSRLEVARRLREQWSDYSRFPRASTADDFVVGNTVTVHGFLLQKRVMSPMLVFARIQVEDGPMIQVVIAPKAVDTPEYEVMQALRALPPHTPVAVTGQVQDLTRSEMGGSKDASSGSSSKKRFPRSVERIDLALSSIQPLNEFSKSIVVSKGVQFPPQSRHLQIRFHESLRSRLLARSHVNLRLREILNDRGFTEVETPILFKSTPEGAREFLVPSRYKQRAYALPQSPQQYKQMLMSTGIRGYYQFARCFRDEDLRADRQPEFTQLDLEMAFATGEDVMQMVESLVSRLPEMLNEKFVMVQNGNEIYPRPKGTLLASEGKVRDGDNHMWAKLQTPFPRLTYEEAMTRFGVDKPDTRIPFEIHRVDHVLSPQFVSMISHLEKPAVDAFKVRLGQDASAAFVDEFLRNLPPALERNPDGAPVALIYNSSKPLNGLSSLGFDGFAGLTSGASGLEEFSDLEDGDILFFQARPNEPFYGGSTALGRLRTLVYETAVSKGLLPRDESFNFLWVTDFPMFTPDNDADPGQGGQAGFSATHHPFTAPLTDRDVELLVTDPLKARADHYDLVLNGVELGGGSRRIHVPELQEYVFREILKMTDKGIAQFDHLLKALSAGCPPHAGFALGFDRLVATLTHTDSIRDVVAFPKSMKGEDLAVGSPGKVTSEQLEVYGLDFAKKSKSSP